VFFVLIENYLYYVITYYNSGVMVEVFRVKLRQIGNSVGLLIPQEQIIAIDMNIGDEVDIALIKPKSKEELMKTVKQTFGIAKNAKDFTRDKDSRAFNVN